MKFSITLTVVSLLSFAMADVTSLSRNYLPPSSSSSSLISSPSRTVTFSSTGGYSSGSVGADISSGGPLFSAPISTFATEYTVPTYSYVAPAISSGYSAPAAIAAPAPVITQSYAAPAPIRYAAPAVQVVAAAPNYAYSAPTYSAPAISYTTSAVESIAPVVQKTYSAPSVIYSAPSTSYTGIDTQYASNGGYIY